jgi:hypothetical protein
MKGEAYTQHKDKSNPVNKELPAKVLLRKNFFFEKVSTVPQHHVIVIMLLWQQILIN